MPIFSLFIKNSTHDYMTSTLVASFGSINRRGNRETGSEESESGASMNSELEPSENNSIDQTDELKISKLEHFDFINDNSYTD